LSSIFTAAYKSSCGIGQKVYLEVIHKRTRFLFSRTTLTIKNVLRAQHSPLTQSTRF